MSTPEDEISTPEAAALIGVSLDTLRSMIREGVLPAKRSRPGGPYVLTRADVEAAARDRAEGMRAGPVRLSEDDRAALRRVRDAEAAADAGVEAAYEARAALVVKLGRLLRGTGAMAATLGVDRSVVQAILRTGQVPTVHHRRATELAPAELVLLRHAQVDIARAKARQDAAASVRAELARTLMDRGGYGIGVEIAHELGRHRSRLTTAPAPRRAQG